MQVNTYENIFATAQVEEDIVAILSKYISLTEEQLMGELGYSYADNPFTYILSIKALKGRHLIVESGGVFTLL